MEPIDQARRYFFNGKGVPPAISGANGHAQAFSAACALRNGFALSCGDAETVFREYNQHCQPPWSDREIAHKLTQAESAPHDKPRGYLLKGQPATRHMPMTQPRPRNESTPAKPATKRHGSPKSNLPTPIPNGTRKLLATVFRPADGVRIVAAKVNEEGREIPDGSGFIMSAKDWIKRLDAKGGNPNGIFRSADKAGIYIGVNPLKIGGKAEDENVTDFRHALLEFDGLSPEEQLGLYEASDIPCAAIILSGGKSVHAWVKIDARDRNEFNQRVAILYSHFEAYGLDGKNKNPARLSRLPNCERFTKRQELLKLDSGAASFTEWLSKGEQEHWGKLMSWDRLLNFDSENDKDCLAGKRWATKGGSILFIGQSGVGKSAMAAQAAILFAIEKSLFGVTPKRRLKTVIMQAENNEGDMSEMMRGAIAGLGLTPDEIEIVKKNVIIYHNTCHSGFEFTQVIHKMIDHHRPDFFFIDPLNSFFGDDISKNVAISQFFRHWMNPISEATGVCWFIFHHTNKPAQDPRSKKGWNNSDFSYMGAGGAELVNWARAVCVLQQTKSGNYELLFAKRGSRAGAMDLNLEHATKIHLAHSKAGICWEQIVEDAESDSEPGKAGRAKKEFDYDGFIKHISSEHFRSTKLVERAAKFADMSERTIHSRVLPELKKRLKFDEEYDCYYA